MTFFNYFDRVWIISMVERTDRRRRIERELTRVGLPLTPGKIEFFGGIRKTEAEGFPSPGYHGCYMSHRAVMGLGIEHAARRILILEDDVVFRLDFKAHEPSVVDALQQRPDWGVVQLGHITSQPVLGAGLVAPPRQVLGTHFYAINGSALPKVKAWYDAALDRPKGHPEGGRMSPDGTLNHFRWANPDVPAYIYAPMLGRQTNSPSNLGGRKWFDQIPVAGSLFRKIRELTHVEKWPDARIEDT